MITSLGPKNVEKQTFQKKTIFPVTKDFGLFFLVLSSVTNLMRQVVKVQKVFWHLLWKLWDHVCNTYEIVENTVFWKKGSFFSEIN